MRTNDQGHDRRTHERSTHFRVEAMFSQDGVTWKETFVSNLSAGGLMHHTDIAFDRNQQLWYYLKIHGYFSEFEVKVQGVIKHVILRGKLYSYGIAFINLPPNIAIQIDENVRAMHQGEGAAVD